MIKLNIEYGNIPISTHGHAPESTYVTKHGLLFADKAAVVLNTLMNGAFSLLVIDLRESLMIYQTAEIRNFGKHLTEVVKFYRAEDKDLDVQLYLPFPDVTGYISRVPQIPLIPTANYLPDLKLFDRVYSHTTYLTKAIATDTQIHYRPESYYHSPMGVIRGLGVKTPISRLVCENTVEYTFTDISNRIYRVVVPKIEVLADPTKHQSVTRIWEYSQPWGTVVTGEL